MNTWNLQKTFNCLKGHFNREESSNISTGTGIIMSRRISDWILIIIGAIFIMVVFIIEEIKHLFRKR
jgi:hypothetical protein